jgi:hypothetical protein
MLGLIVAIEGVVSRGWLDLTDPVSLSWRFSAEAAHRDAPGREVLCLGDSLVKHGLVPSVIARESGLSAANLAAARCPTLMTYFLFRRALEAGAHPPAIVFNSKPAVLIGSPDYNARYWQEVLSWREGLELAGIGGRAQLLTTTLLGRLLPSLRWRPEVRSSVLSAFRGQTDRLHEVNRILWRNWTVNEGANVASLHSQYRGELPSDVEATLHPSAFHVNKANLRGIERLLHLAAERGIRVFWLLPPLSPALQSRREASGSEAKFERFVRSSQARYPRVVTVLDARRSAYPPEMFVDATHLGGRGAIALSRVVARAVRAELSHKDRAPARGWIALEGPHPEPAGDLELALEDLDRSRVVLERDGTSGRTLR